MTRNIQIMQQANALAVKQGVQRLENQKYGVKHQLLHAHKLVFPDLHKNISSSKFIGKISENMSSLTIECDAPTIFNKLIQM